MEFYLVKEKHVAFEDLPIRFEQNFAERKTSLEACLQLTEAHQDEQNKRDFELLKDLVEKNVFEESNSPDGVNFEGRKCIPSKTQETSATPAKLNGSLLISVGMHNVAGDRPFVRITDAAKGNLLQKLNDVTKTCGVRFKIKVSCSKCCCKDNYGNAQNFSQSGKDKWSAFGDLEQVSLDTKGIEGIQLMFDHNGPFDNWVLAIYKEHTAVLSIICTAYPNATVSVFSSKVSFPRKNLYKTILENEIKPDATIITKDNTEVKCHRSILSVQSDVLEKNFKGCYAESQTNVVQMIDMTTASVKAFLAYLYYFDTDKAIASSNIAVEVFQASHKYNVSSLEEEMKSYLLTKPDKWFEVEPAVDLFLFARNLEGGNELKIRAVQVIKINYASFKTSSKYKELMKDNLEAVMELLEIVCML